MIESEAYSAKAARAGKDIGKKGKNFDKIAKKAAERYGSEERGKKVAGAILKKLRMKEEAEQLGEKAPPGKKFERMVKHIKKGYESGGLTKQEKGIAYATAWKSYNKEEVEPVNEVKVGDKVHVGMNQKGGSGFKGTVHKIDGENVHVKVDTTKYGDRIVKGQMKNVTKEEVEQIDELKTGTLLRYATKATKSLTGGDRSKENKRIKGIQLAKHKIQQKPKMKEEVEPIQESYTLYHKSYTDAVNHAFAHHAKSGLKSSDDDRMQHVGLGSKKPGEGKTTTVNIPATHEKTGKKHMIHIQVYNKGGSKPYELNTYSSTTRSMQKESEQVSELSTELLGRYKKAAVDSYREADKRGDVAKTNKRFKGTITATNKQFANDLKKRASKQNEEVELDEAIPKSTGIALVHRASKKIVAKGNKEQMMKKMKELNSKEKDSHHLGATYRGKVGDTFGEEVEQVDEVIGNTTGYSDSGPRNKADERKFHQMRNVVTKGPRTGKITKHAQNRLKDRLKTKTYMEEVEQEKTNMSIKFTEFRSRLDEAPYMGKGNHKPGWMLRADPELARKFKEIEDRKKRMNSMMKKYGGKTGDEIDKMKKEEVEQVDERNKENKVKKNAYVSSIIQKKLHPSVLPSLKYGRQELKKEEVEQVDERNPSNE
jgi:hypothetical protein